MSDEWQPINTAPLNETVWTKIHDEQGERNVAKLKSSLNGKLWFFPDGSMYVYYTPTHWRSCSLTEVLPKAQKTL